MRTWQSDEQRQLRAGPHRRKQMMTEHWQVHMPDVSRQGVAMQVLSAHETLTNRWGYSSGVEHLTADQEVPGSNPGAPFSWDFGITVHIHSIDALSLLTHG